MTPSNKLIGTIRTKRVLPSAAAVAVGWAVLVAGRPTPPPMPDSSAARDTTVSFQRDVLPILESRCAQCHGGVDEYGDVVAEEGLDVTTYEKLLLGSTYGSVVEPGNPDESYIVEMVEMGDMPKDDDPLTPEQVQLIRQWVLEGALDN